MAEIKRPDSPIARLGMRPAELLRLRPILEIRVGAPDRMGRVKGVILALGAFQQVKDDEARQLMQVALAAQPKLLKLLFRAFRDLEAVHRDVHDSIPLMLPSLKPNAGPANPCQTGLCFCYPPSRHSTPSRVVGPTRAL